MNVIIPGIFDETAKKFMHTRVLETTTKKTPYIQIKEEEDNTVTYTSIPYKEGIYDVKVPTTETKAVIEEFSIKNIPEEYIIKKRMNFPSAAWRTVDRIMVIDNYAGDPVIFGHTDEHRYILTYNSNTEAWVFYYTHGKPIKTWDITEYLGTSFKKATFENPEDIEGFNDADELIDFLEF